MGNVGDSRAVLCSDGKAVDLSVDHKPNRPDEEDRIRVELLFFFDQVNMRLESRWHCGVL